MAEGAPIKVTVKVMSGNSFTVDTTTNTTVAEFREQVAGPSGIQPESQRIIFAGRILKDPETLASYNIKDGSAVHLVRAATNTAQTQAAGQGSSSSQQRQPAAGSQSQAAGQSQGLGGMPSPFNVDPQMMEQMMRSPIFDQLLGNTEILRQMINMNPQVQQLLEQNPELRHALNDETTLRQSMEALRNPAMRQELMRQQDRMMSNVEAMPGGFNHLARFFSNVQDPLMDAMSGSGDSSRSTVTPGNPFVELLAPDPSESSRAPNSEALPNPWGAGSTTGSAPSTTSGSGGSGSGTGAVGGMPNFASLFGAGAGGGAGGGATGSMPGMPGMPGTNLTPEQMGRLMSNPNFLAMSQRLMQSPEIREASALMMSGNQAEAMQRMQQAVMNNPELAQQAMNPEMMELAMSVMGGGGGAGGVPGATDSTPAGFGGMPGGFPFSMFGAGIPGAQTAGGDAGQPPRERFAAQLEQLQSMGFADEQANIQALTVSGGDVSRAVQFLLGN